MDILEFIGGFVVLFVTVVGIMLLIIRPLYIMGEHIGYNVPEPTTLTEIKTSMNREHAFEEYNSRINEDEDDEDEEV